MKRDNQKQNATNVDQLITYQHNFDFKKTMTTLGRSKNYEV